LVRAVVDKRERQVLRREAFFRIAGRFTPTVTAEIGGLRFHVSTDDLGVGRQMFSGIEPDRRTLERVVHVLSSAGTNGLADRSLIDVGANIGTTTVTALRAFGMRDAICFEPVPDSYELLLQNVNLNDVQDRVRHIPVALSSSAGITEMELFPVNSGAARVLVGEFAEGDAEEANRSIIKVQTRTFDSFVEEGHIDLDQVGLAWMDVQAHEAEVLAGATKLVDSGVPVVIEFWPYGLRRAHQLEPLLALIRSGYGRVIDLRSREDGVDGVPYAPSELDDLERRYPGNAQTDLLLLK
jgi:FkbM family methyltransferase